MCFLAIAAFSALVAESVAILTIRYERKRKASKRAKEEKAVGPTTKAYVIDPSTREVYEKNEEEM